MSSVRPITSRQRIQLHRRPLRLREARVRVWVGEKRKKESALARDSFFGAAARRAERQKKASAGLKREWVAADIRIRYPHRMASRTSSLMLGVSAPPKMYCGHTHHGHGRFTRERRPTSAQPPPQHNTTHSR